MQYRKNKRNKRGGGRRTPPPAAQNQSKVPPEKQNTQSPADVTEPTKAAHNPTARPQTGAAQTATEEKNAVQPQSVVMDNDSSEDSKPHTVPHPLRKASVNSADAPPRSPHLDGPAITSAEVTDAPRHDTKEKHNFVESFLFRRFIRRHEAYVNYQHYLPYKTVVPEPPHTLREYLGAMLWFCVSRAFWACFFFVTFPALFVLHALLKFLDRRQRRIWQRFQLSWPYASVPHVRPVRYPADEHFPLSQWHLRCEDGRQRWYFGEPLMTHEVGNTLGYAQAAGFQSVEELKEQRSHKDIRYDAEALAKKKAQRAALEQYQLGLLPAAKPAPRRTAENAMDDGIQFLLKLQDPFSGHWPNDYSGCMFLTPGLVFATFITAGGDLRAMFPPAAGHVHGHEPAGSGPVGLLRSLFGRTPPLEAPGPTAPGKPCRCGEATHHELIRYIRNYQNDDGGWGQHTEGGSTMLGTVLNYTTLRLLGVAAGDKQLTRAREWIQMEGGAVYTPMWGKVWLSILGVYSWDGVNPIPPELVLLPQWVPFAVGRSWCHSRVIATAFAYFYGLRWSAPRHPLLDALKTELYTQPYASIRWRHCRSLVSKRDLYTPTSALYRAACAVLDLYERQPIRSLRRYALERCWQLMAYDDENTHFICLGPVNKSLNMLATWIREGPKSARYQLHRQRTADYLYAGPEGMRMSGYNGAQLWDTAFAVQAICACQREMDFPEELALAHHYVTVAQVQKDPIEAALFDRHRTRGAWNFSTSPQGWQVSDCTAEGLRVVLLLSPLPFPPHRLYNAVDEILSLRNCLGDGGWASYEPTRAPAYCELMNCSELFNNVMVEYSYAECSSSCVHSLALFRQHHPQYRRAEVDRAIREGIICVLRKQRPDGSFYGSWAVCFTYAAWIVADALRVSGELLDMANHPNCRRLIDFLMSHQNGDGGWGEDINACVRQVWVDNPDGSQVVNTAWAVMAIMSVSGDSQKTSLPRRQKIRLAVERGIRLIMSRQLETGDWAQERISGVFNGNNPIHYAGYKNSMTVWALGKYNAWKHAYQA